MPCVGDWLNSPLSIVQGIFAQNVPNSDWEKKVTEYFKEKLKENNATNWVPSLNDVPVHYLKPNSLVKFRCMVQDMFDPEFYMGVYETVDPNTNARVLHFGKYRDVAECGVSYINYMNLEKKYWVVYESWESFKVNDVLEVFGVLSVDPVLSIVNSEDRDSSTLDPMECMDTAEEQRVHSPPASLVPRIHVILAQKLQHINPLLPACLNEEESKTFVSNFMSELSPVRAELLGFLTHALLGDSLAAEYLILHLISTVYARRDVLPLGKFTVNLSGCPRSSAFTEHLYRLIQQLVPASYHLRMSIESMNQSRFIPRKDYTANRLLSGLLQLASNTSLVIDETQLEQGQLDTAGVHNVTALGDLITWQKVEYDFNYHRMEFPCNINVLITSEGRSLLPSDCQVHLQPQIIPPNMEEYMSSLLTAVLPSVLNKFRIYLSLLRLLDYSISEEVTKAVEEDFVEMRKNNPESVTADDLHKMLLVARFLSLSAGQTTLSRERWLRAKQLEALRKARLQQQKCVNGNEL
ncbi:minichromosome maintenance complex binding protein [Turdus rufiventris]|nr:minichromosome maintenance complex binding protein [Turdus rufiventris]